MSKDEVVNLMLSSKSEKEWNDNCEKVVKGCGGQYPSFWYKEIILSGVYGNVSEEWKKNQFANEE